MFSWLFRTYYQKYIPEFVLIKILLLPQLHCYIFHFSILFRLWKKRRIHTWNYWIFEIYQLFKINFLIIRTTYVTDRDPKYFFDPNSLWLTFIHSTVDWLILSNSQLFQLFPLFMKSKSPRLPIKCSLTLSVVRLNFWRFFVDIYVRMIAYPTVWTGLSD